MNEENEILNLADNNKNQSPEQINIESGAEAQENIELSKNNQNKNLNKNNSNNLNSQKEVMEYFKTKEYSEIIRNPDCAFIKEDTDKNYYYFCLCSEKAYFPICEPCALSCHKSHNPQIKIEGYFTCNCGLKNHQISQRSEKRFLEKSEIAKKCFYKEFTDKSNNRGFFKQPGGKSLCSICFFASECNAEMSAEEKQNSESYFIPNFKGSCECDKHHHINVVTLSNELDKDIILNNFLLNFNFNIISICDSLKKIFIDFLNEQIEELIDYEIKKKQIELLNKGQKGNSLSRAASIAEPFNSFIFQLKDNKDPYIVFYTDFVIFTLFKIFGMFRKDYSSQYLHVKNIFSEKINPQHLVQILKQTVNFQRLLDYNENVELYFKTKVNYAFMIYHVYIKAHFLNFNNLLNLKSLLNLNIVQRILYIHQSKKFYRFAIYSQSLSKTEKPFNPSEKGDIPLFSFDEKLENWENFIFEFADELINIVDTMLQVHDNLPIIKNVMSDTMITISKIMKFIIKYNLIDDDLKGKYFQFMLDTLVAFVNELDNSEKEYWDTVSEIAEDVESEEFSDLSHAKQIELLEAAGKKNEILKLNEKFLENENLKDNVWFVLPIIKSIFYNMLKKNDDLVIKKLKGQFNKIQSQEKYCFISSSEADTLSKIFLLCLKIFNENSYRNLNKQSVYKKKILKFDLYVKKILELLNGNSEFYLKSLESIIHQFKRKIDSLFIQDLGEEKNNKDAYINYFKQTIFAENNINNKLYNKLNMKVLTSEDYHLEILKSLNFKLYEEFNEVNIDFGNLNRKFYEYDIDFNKFTEEANIILERFQNFFKKLEFKPEKIKQHNNIGNDSIFGGSLKNVDQNNNNINKINKNYINNNSVDFIQINNSMLNNSFNENANNGLNNKNNDRLDIIEEDNKLNNDNNLDINNNNNIESQSYLKSERANVLKDNSNMLNNSLLLRSNKININNDNNDFNEDQSDNTNNAVSNYLMQKDSIAKKNQNFQRLNNFKQFIGYTDFLENFNEFLDIYSRSKSFDPKLNALNIRYDLLKFILNMLYIISDDSNENLILIMTINPIKLVDAFFDYKEELCLLLVRIANIVSKFDYNDNYFFLTDLINSIISKLKVEKEDGMSKENFAVFTSVLKAFKKILPKYNIYNNEIINTYEIINNKIIEIKNNEKMMKEIDEFVNGLFPGNGNNARFSRSSSFDNQEFEIAKKVESNLINPDKSLEDNGNLNNNNDNNINKINENENNNNDNNDNDNAAEKIILNENKFENKNDISIETINGTLKLNNNLNNPNNKSNKFIKKSTNNIKDKYFKSDVYIFESFFKHYFALLNISFDKDLYYYDLFYDKQIIILNKIQLKEITSNARNLSISFREEVEKFLHNYNLKSKIKFSTVEREFSRFQRKTNTEKGNLKYIFSGKYKDALNFSCEILEKQLENFMQNCGLNLFNKNYFNNLNNSNNNSNNIDFNSEDNSIYGNKNGNEDLYSRKDSGSNNLFIFTNKNNSDNNNNLNNDNYNKEAYNKLSNNKIANGESQYIKINSVFSYLENAIISPLYKIINMYMIVKEKLIGEDYFTVYKLVFYLHQILFALYTSPLANPAKPSLSKLPSTNTVHYTHLSKYFYGDIKQKLCELNLDYLSRNLNKLKDLKYFQFEETINIFRVTLALIKKNNTFNFIHLRKQFYRFNVIENSYLGCYDENSKDAVFVDFYEEIVSEAADFFLDSQEKKIYEIIEDYKKTLGETFGDQFSIIKVLSSTDLDCEVNLTGILFNYIINKFADKLTRANQNLDIPQNIFSFDFNYKKDKTEIINDDTNENNNENNNDKDIDIDKSQNNKSKVYDFKNFVEGKNLKMQNFYVLFFLRNLFFFDPEKFQEALTNLFTKVVVKKQGGANEEDKYLNKSDTNIKGDEANNALNKSINEGSSLNNQLEKKNSKLILSKKNSSKNKSKTEDSILSENEELQETKEIDKEKIHYFFSIINKYFIFGNLLCEAGKLFELYNERTLIRSNFIYDLLITNIFLMQNICEGHNQTLQELMFDLRLMPISQENSEKSVNNYRETKEQQIAAKSKEMLMTKNLLKKSKKIIIDKERIKFIDFLAERKNFEFSYVNFLSNLMRNIVSSLYFDFDNRYVFLNKTFSLNSNFTCVYNKLTDLLIEMIQGTQEHNLFNFFIAEEDWENQAIPADQNLNQFKEFQFLVFLHEIKNVIKKDGDDPEKEFSVIKTLTFSVINNILNQESVNQDFVRLLLKIFDIDFLIGKMSIYMKKSIVRFQQGILYEHPQFAQLVKKISLKNFSFEDFYKIFLSNEELQQDDYFLLCVQIYYFINITGDKFYMQDAMDVLELQDNQGYNNSKKSKQEEMFTNAIFNSKDLEIENTLFLKSNKLENKIKLFFEKTLKKKNLFERKINKKALLAKSSRNSAIPGNANYNNSFDMSAISAGIMLNKDKSNKNQNGNANLIKNEENADKKVFNKNENNNLSNLNVYIVDNNENKNKISNNIIQENKEEPVKITPLPDVLYTKNFYSKIINSVEFLIEDESGAKVKEIYFIKNPKGYLINENNIRRFFKTADRSDAATKITSLLDSLESFQLEIDYILKAKNKVKKNLLRYDYKITDLISFIISLIINLILLFSLTSENIDDISLREPIFDSVITLGIVQIALNFVSLIIFLAVKQSLWISYELNKIRKTEFSYMGNSIIDNEVILAKLSFFTKLKVYLVYCFLLNEEVILINLNLVLGIIGVSQFYATMVFTLQLITVVRFVETIRDIVIAFRSKFDQLIAMVFFLLFLIYFYTNVAFYFLNAEYKGRGLGNGGNNGSEDVCDSLIRCFIYHFNEGVRSGGGIGDNLDFKSWGDLGLFFGRWLLDMVFFISVLLLLLNMINGIIVSTFSAIREESEQKADDEENRCFICSIDKAEFEKRKINFETHIKKEHNVKHYINFIIYLRLTPNKDLDSNQGYIKKCIENRNINVFPIYQSKALGPGIFDNPEEE